MRVRGIVPEPGEVELERVLAGLEGPNPAPFAGETLALLAALSDALFLDARAKRFPELTALAFWLRRANLERLRRDFDALATPGTLLVPRGLVFHVTPANVDTLFVYSLLFGLLAGCRNVVRLSERSAPQTDLIVELVNGLLATGAHEAARGALRVVTYPHDAAITAALSARADVRVVWGGDATVEAIRRAPLAPHAKELVFPDRSSFAAVNAERYLALDDAGRRDLAAKAANDAFWFDQLACSSPRLVVWCGSAAATQRARELYWAELARVAAARFPADTATALAKLTFAHGAVIDRPVETYRRWSNELTVLVLERLEGFDRAHPGGGLFFDARVDRLAELVPFVERRDQTLAASGFAEDELVALARALNGRGLDRIVPFGDALTFDRFWDGYDLLQELTRRVVVRAT